MFFIGYEFYAILVRKHPQVSIKERLVLDHSSELEVNPFEYGFNIGFALTTRNKTIFDTTLTQFRRSQANSLITFSDYI